MSIQDLREKRKAKAQEARHLLDQNPGDKWNDECNKKYDALVEELDRIDAEIDREEKVLALEGKGQRRVEDLEGRFDISTDEATDIANREQRVFDSWLRGGLDNLTSEDRQFVAEMRSKIRNTMSTGTGSQGGYTVPTEFARQLIEEMKAFGGMRSVATILSTASGAHMDWPTTDATSEEGEIVGENAAVSNADPAFGIKSLGAYKFSSKTVAVPFELLQDSGIDIEAHIRKRLVTRLQRGTNRYFTTGTGTSQPEGIVTAATSGKVGATGQTTGVIYDDLVDLQHSVDPAYRTSEKCGWMFNDSTLKVLKKLKDGYGRPLWLPGLATKEPDTILSKPYTINQHMADMAANAKSILFGDFGYYTIRDVMQILLFRMTDSAYTEKGQVGFLAFSRHDGALMDYAGNSVKYYQNSAT